MKKKEKKITLTFGTGLKFKSERFDFRYSIIKAEGTSLFHQVINIVQRE